MRNAIYPLLICAAAVPALAAESAQPNTLSAKEIADGWILLFDGKTTFGWKIDGTAKIEDGALVLGGTKATRAETTTPLPIVNCFTPMEVKWDGASPPKVFTGSQMTPLENECKRRFQIYTVGVREWAQMPVAPVKFEVPAGSKLYVRNLKYRPSEQSIFNGKDLTGWKEIKTNRTKSVVNVTPEGWIHMKNGPGDLQTIEQWGDFVLQAECRTNGKELNSGIFFRCQPDKYQQGYECQIHNGFLATPKDYTIEEFDPATHKSISKKKVKYAAKDYGTGAIYRRQPARFQVAKDNEWFTMTIIAQGNHYATWVNGIQVTDWTDNRPAADNARNGYRKEKGPISLQGHDPTTDLNFRNIRIAELPPASTDKK